MQQCHKAKKNGQKIKRADIEKKLMFSRVKVSLARRHIGGQRRCSLESLFVEIKPARLGFPL